MPHAIGKSRKQSNYHYGVEKRIQVAYHMKKKLGPGTTCTMVQSSPLRDHYGVDFILNTQTGQTILVKVKSQRLRTKTQNRFFGFDFYCLWRCLNEYKRLTGQTHNITTMTAHTIGGKVSITPVDLSHIRSDL